MLIRGEIIKTISDALGEFEYKVRNRNSIHLYDVNTESEDFVCGLINRIYGYSLTNLNSTVQQNFPGIDLGSTDDGIAVQVTTDNKREKIQHTLDIFRERKYNNVFSRLWIVIIGEKKSYRKPFETDDTFDFDYKTDIIDIRDLIKVIDSIQDTKKLEELSQYILFELGKIGDKGDEDSKLLEQESRTVRALCVSKMTTLGISRECAESILNDDVKSDRFDYIIKSNKPYLIGEYGTGKSHALYVLYLKQYESFSNNKTVTIPRFSNIKEVEKVGGIEAWAGIDWLEKHESILFLDGLDEVEYQEINRIYDEVAYLTERYRSCSVIIGSRHLSVLDDSKCINIRYLDDDSIDRIYRAVTNNDEIISTKIKRSEGKGLNYMKMLNRPFFLLLYSNLQKDRNFVFSNEIDIFNAFIDKSLKKQIDTASAKYQISKFAAQLLNNNMISIHETMIDSSIETNVLLKSGLIVRDRNGFYSSPLPIVAQWLAAIALRDGVVDFTKIVCDKHRLMAWRYPISIYFSMVSFDSSKEQFAKMIINYPSIAGMIITDGIKRNHINFQDDSRNAGEKLQYCMSAWSKASPSLLKLLKLTEEDGRPNSLRVYVNGSRIQYSWSSKRLDYDYKVSKGIKESRFHDWEIGRDIPQQATWPWIITFETIKYRLKKAIKERLFIITDSQLEKEFVWKTALEKKKYGSLYDGEIHIIDYIRCWPNEEYLKFFNEKDKRFYECVSELYHQGVLSITPPFPVGDRKIKTGSKWIWNDYSISQMLRRIQFEYNNGVSEYKRLVERYLLQFKNELSLFVALPAKIIGQLTYDDHINQADWSSHPVISTYVLPLKKDCKTEIDISYDNEVNISSEKIWQDVKKSIEQNRFDDIDFVYSSLRSGVCFNATATPVTDWVYDRLKEDLKKISWYD